MNCPACREALIVLEHEQIEVDHCVSCKGVWLDAGELELLLGDSAEKDRLIASFRAAAGSSEKRRKCPICSKRMEKVLCGDGAKVRIDRCRGGDGVWFDLGELDEIVKLGSFGKSAKALDWLKGMFGKKGSSGRGGIR